MVSSEKVRMLVVLELKQRRRWPVLFMQADIGAYGPMSSLEMRTAAEQFWQAQKFDVRRRILRVPVPVPVYLSPRSPVPAALEA